MFTLMQPKILRMKHLHKLCVKFEHSACNIDDSCVKPANWIPLRVSWTWLIAKACYYSCVWLKWRASLRT